jgi:two-component system, NarL family, response regulator NreC
MSTRILLADDHEIFRNGLKAVLSRHPDNEIVAEAADGETAVRLAGELRPDIVVMDIGMPQLNGIEATRQIRGNPDCSQTKIIALSIHTEGPVVRRMLEAGAAGYLLKDVAGEELVHAIQSVQQGEIYLGSGLASVVARQIAPSGAPALSRREEEVLKHIAEGLTTKEIARVLNVSPKTVDTHRQHLMGKLKIHSIAELTKYALRLGLTTLQPGGGDDNIPLESGKS